MPRRRRHRRSQCCRCSALTCSPGRASASADKRRRSTSCRTIPVTGAMSSRRFRVSIHLCEPNSCNQLGARFNRRRSSAVSRAVSSSRTSPPPALPLRRCAAGAANAPAPLRPADALSRAKPWRRKAHQVPTNARRKQCTTMCPVHGFPAAFVFAAGASGGRPRSISSPTPPLVAPSQGMAHPWCDGPLEPEEQSGFRGRAPRKKF